MIRVQNMNVVELQGTKIVEIPYFAYQIDDLSKSVLIVGERHGGEGVSITIKEMGLTDVTTTDIVDVIEESWLKKNVPNWKHVKSDFVQFDDRLKYDYIVAISIFEHFGFWFLGDNPSIGEPKSDLCHWDYDIAGINKACMLLKDKNSKLMITLPAGPYMNYEESGVPWLRGYDLRRQTIIKREVTKNGFNVINEKFFYSSDYNDWKDVGTEINGPENYKLYNPFTPNVIWAFTITK